MADVTIRDTLLDLASPEGRSAADYKDAPMKLSVSNLGAMLVDRGYDSDSFRQDLLINDMLPVIASRKSRSAPQKTDWKRRRD
ncbi:transposase [Gluconobacter oxydans]|uniref:hypothetical protein n=1 Tax=Gluconobacter thailandicus TaxID=257438 RepID=UPI0002996A36|nr:hypothetical protein [Gluconobacter thailandicus]AFW02540.1 transposase [Gluconobacter oxydans H24]ANQ41970.1 transposase [Gluconobacter oxydans]